MAAPAPDISYSNSYAPASWAGQLPPALPFDNDYALPWDRKASRIQRKTAHGGEAKRKGSILQNIKYALGGHGSRMEGESEKREKKFNQQFDFPSGREKLYYRSRRCRLVNYRSRSVVVGKMYVSQNFVSFRESGARKAGLSLVLPLREVASIQRGVAETTPGSSLPQFRLLTELNQIADTLIVYMLQGGVHHFTGFWDQKSLEDAFYSLLFAWRPFYTANEAGVAAPAVFFAPAVITPTLIPNTVPPEIIAAALAVPATPVASVFTPEGTVRLPPAAVAVAIPPAPTVVVTETVVQEVPAQSILFAEIRSFNPSLLHHVPAPMLQSPAELWKMEKEAAITQKVRHHHRRHYKKSRKSPLLSEIRHFRGLRHVPAPVLKSPGELWLLEKNQMPKKKHHHHHKKHHQKEQATRSIPAPLQSEIQSFSRTQLRHVAAPVMRGMRSHPVFTSKNHLRRSYPKLAGPLRVSIIGFNRSALRPTPSRLTQYWKVARLPRPLLWSIVAFTTFGSLKKFRHVAPPTSTRFLSELRASRYHAVLSKSDRSALRSQIKSFDKQRLQSARQQRMASIPLASLTESPQPMHIAPSLLQDVRSFHRQRMRHVTPPPTRLVERFPEPSPLRRQPWWNDFELAITAHQPGFNLRHVEVPERKPQFEGMKKLKEAPAAAGPVKAIITEQTVTTVVVQKALTPNTQRRALETGTAITSSPYTSRRR